MRSDVNINRVKAHKMVFQSLFLHDHLLYPWSRWWLPGAYRRRTIPCTINSVTIIKAPGNSVRSTIVCMFNVIVIRRPNMVSTTLGSRYIPNSCFIPQSMCSWLKNSVGSLHQQIKGFIIEFGSSGGKSYGQLTYTFFEFVYLSDVNVVSIVRITWRCLLQ